MEVKIVSFQLSTEFLPSPKRRKLEEQVPSSRGREEGNKRTRGRE